MHLENVLNLSDDVFDTQIALCLLKNVSTSGDTTASPMDITHCFITHPTDVCITCKVLTRVKDRLEAGLQNRRFVRMPKAAGDRHRLWGVTAAFVLQMPALRRFCGLMETVICPEEHGEWTEPELPEGRVGNDQAYETADNSFHAGKHDDDISTVDVVREKGVQTGTVPVGETCDHMQWQEKFCSRGHGNGENEIHSDDEASNANTMKRLITSLRDLKPEAHDSAIDTTGFFEENDSDCSDTSDSLKRSVSRESVQSISSSVSTESWDLVVLNSDTRNRLKRSGSHESVQSISSSASTESWDKVVLNSDTRDRLKRSGSHESVQSISSSVSVNSWDLIVRNISMRRSISSDSLGSQVSSGTDSALSTSEDERNGDYDHDGQLLGTPDAYKGDKLYAVDDRHTLLLEAIRWTSFEDLLKVLRLHAEEEGYASAAGPGECELQVEESEESGTSDIIRQAFLVAMTTPAEDDFGITCDSVSPAILRTPTLAGSISTAVLDLASDSDHRSLTTAFLYSTSSENNEIGEMKMYVPQTRSTSDSDKDKTKENRTEPTLQKPNDGQLNIATAQEQRSFCYFINTPEKGKYDRKSRDGCTEISGSDSEPNSPGQLRTRLASSLDFHNSCTSNLDSDSDSISPEQLQTGLDTPLHCPHQTLQSCTVQTTGSEYCEFNETQACKSANSSPSSGSEASNSFNERGIRINFNSEASNDGSLQRSPNSVQRRRHLMHGYASPSSLHHPQEPGPSYLAGGVFISTRSSFDDSNQSDLTLSPDTHSHNQWPFSDVFCSPASLRAIIDESAEASRWLEDHSADSSSYSPCMVSAGCRCPSVLTGQCSRHPLMRSHLPLSDVKEEPVKSHRRPIISRGSPDPGNSTTRASSSGSKAIPMSSTIKQSDELTGFSSTDSSDSLIQFRSVERV